MSASFHLLAEAHEEIGEFRGCGALRAHLVYALHRRRLCPAPRSSAVWWSGRRHAQPLRRRDQEVATRPLYKTAR